MIAGYLSELTTRLTAAVGDRLLGAWVIGSGALGDFDAQRSDIDVQAVSAARLPRAELEELAAALSHDALPCPVRGLEFVLYAQEDLATDGRWLSKGEAADWAAARLDDPSPVTAALRRRADPDAPAPPPAEAAALIDSVRTRLAPRP